MTSTITISGSVGGVPMSSQISRTADGSIGQDPSLAAAKAGTLSVRTDADSGTLALGGGHGVTTGAKFDVYWDGGSRYNMTASTVSGNNVPFNNTGTGDDMPALNTVVTVMVHQVVDVDLDGDLLEMLGASCKKAATILLFNDTTIHLAIQLDANEPYEWHSGGMAANPIAGDVITHATMTHADSAAAQKVSLGILYNSTE